MANAIVVKTKVQAQNIDALNRSARAVADIKNGTAVTLAWSATEGDEVFTATASTSGMAFKVGRKEDLDVADGTLLAGEKIDAWYLEVTTGGWMAISPEVNLEAIGAVYGGADAREFTNKAGKPFDVVNLQVGDIIQVTKPFFKATKDPATVTGANVVTLTSGEFVASVQS